MEMTLTQRDRWMTALESGEYAQTQSVLRNERGFCCLGVLETIEGTPWVPNAFNNHFTFIGDGLSRDDSNDIASACLTKKTHNKYKTDLWGPKIPREVLSPSQLGRVSVCRDVSLPDLNDHGLTFPEIAAILKQVIIVVPEQEVTA